MPSGCGSVSEVLPQQGAGEGKGMSERSPLDEQWRHLMHLSLEQFLYASVARLSLPRKRRWRVGPRETSYVTAKFSTWFHYRATRLTVLDSIAKMQRNQALHLDQGQRKQKGCKGFGLCIILALYWNHTWAFSSFWHSEIIGVVLGVVTMSI